jgi:hypothetical protein
MLDPLTALSLASSLVQLVDFSITLVKDAREISLGGRSVDVNELEIVTADLIGLNAALKRRTGPGVGVEQSLAIEEQVC